jgi:F-type H+-transporting ATPase subunit delta
MTVNAYARRYSQAIFRMALEQKDLNKWQSDLRKVAILMKDTALLSLVTNPRLSGAEKSQNLKQRLGDINPQVIKLVLLLAAKNKVAELDSIAEEYQALVDSYRGIEGTEIAEVTTAIPLDADYQLKVAQRITDIVGKPVMLRPKVDPAIIGGIIIRVGDKLIDGSVRSKLAALKKDLGGVAK